MKNKGGPDCYTCTKAKERLVSCLVGLRGETCYKLANKRYCVWIKTLGISYRMSLAGSPFKNVKGSFSVLDSVVGREK